MKSKRKTASETQSETGTAFQKAAAHERAANRKVRDDWQRCADHRACLTAAILQSGEQRRGRAALLGAGNCNDVDLIELASHFAEVHLVDIDAEAINEARHRLPLNLRGKVYMHGPVDLSGLLATWNALGQRVPTFSEMDAWAEKGAQNVQASLPGPFDVVVSCCLLTQMSWGLRQALGHAHPALEKAREALMGSHLRGLAKLAQGGRALLACDMTSNESYPLDQLASDVDLQALTQDLIAAQNFYQGANPVLLRRLLRADGLKNVVAETLWLKPWLWHASLDRTYLVYAFQFNVDH